MNPEVSGFFNAMFTGIITSLGKVIDKRASRLTVGTDKEFIRGLSLGSSVAVDGICLTVVSKKSISFSVDYMPETEKKTNLRYLKVQDLVNLELPATPTTFLSGHIVQGHIDGVVNLRSFLKDGNGYIFKFSVPNLLAKYIVEKGSIVINGISLTVIEAGKDFFTVGIIPHTFEKTMLYTLKLGEKVNIEVDILAKYLKRLLPK